MKYILQKNDIIPSLSAMLRQLENQHKVAVHGRLDSVRRESADIF